MATHEVHSIRVGLVGAGPWARSVHAPGLAEHSGTTLAAVWARRPEAAAEVASANGATAVGTFDELLSTVDAVAFAVPPAIQADLAVRAAEAGKHVVLEKPIASTVDEAERLADKVSEAGVASLVMLTRRFTPAVASWLDGVRSTGGWTGGNAKWLSGALLGGVYSHSPWRHDGGALADIGPHTLDLLDAALGPITGVLAAHRVAEDDLWHLLLEHEGGATSTVTMCMRLPVQPTVIDFAVFGEHGYRDLQAGDGTPNEAFSVLLDDFGKLISSGDRSHPCDVHRGVHLQKVLDAVLRKLG
ncbi:putative dehydrogenase [Herbihabitans rhizosphaerae]|uniref:Putative dehydrogenase n=1 Tax=Herbihabitans rhizosphaerae TaxID=1872711 RepID=A0A4Q7KW66_9PSEU|nr:Gfo/Idh/MocA family oxidoreductase [Herbihabitans rhizosphaerae]RZS41299.1 putative dehydrogenase [Herbihabitans rhizosphaerae]